MHHPYPTLMCRDRYVKRVANSTTDSAIILPTSALHNVMPSLLRRVEEIQFEESSEQKGKPTSS